jgi:hypothetical protein
VRFRKATVFFGRLVLGIVAGSVVGASYWAVLLAFSGANLVHALQGQVDDALGKLQALLTLGVMFGAAVGFCAGLRALSSGESHAGKS